MGSGSSRIHYPVGKEASGTERGRPDYRQSEFDDLPPSGLSGLSEGLGEEPDVFFNSRRSRACGIPACRQLSELSVATRTKCAVAMKSLSCTDHACDLKKTTAFAWVRLGR